MLTINKDTATVLASITVIIVLNVWVFYHAGSADFINWDDDVYVYENAIILDGISRSGWQYAWSLNTPPYFIPITWLSFMLNAEISGSNPGAFHLTNLALHIASSLFVFALFRTTTGDNTRSLIVAALFAVHPLHVEGVMWIAQRKEMLSTFFALISLLLYVKYSRSMIHRKAWYSLMLITLLLSLLSKPMWLTMPALLILLDIWPLQRISVGLSRLIIEKIPVAVVCILIFLLNVTTIDWNTTQLVQSVDVNPFSAGWASIPYSYAVYIWKTFVPYPLAVPYTNFSEPLSDSSIAISLTVLFILTILVIRWRYKAPWIFIGWFWFLISAATVLFSFGSGKITPLADHWSYVPHIGFFATLVWCLPLGKDINPFLSRATIFASIIIVITLGSLAHTQAQYWRDTPSLWSHVTTVTYNNHVAYWRWGIYEWKQGNHALGERLMRKAQQIHSSEAYYVYVYGSLLLDAGRNKEGLKEYNRLLETPLASPDILTKAGIGILRRLEPAKAEPFLTRATELTVKSESADPSLVMTYLWIALIADNRDPEANTIMHRIFKRHSIDLDTYCTEVTELLRGLAQLDPLWGRYALAIHQRCPNSRFIRVEPTTSASSTDSN